MHRQSTWFLILCHLQWLIHVGGQNGQQVINATDEEGTLDKHREGIETQGETKLHI